MRSEKVYVGVGDRGGPNGKVQAFSVLEDGTLSPSGLFDTGGATSAVVVDPTAKFVYAANTNGTMAGFTITPDNKLTPVPGSPFPLADTGVKLAVEPTGRFLYAAGLSSIQLVTIDQASGALEPGATVSLPGHANSIGIDPTGRFLYVSQFNLQGVVSVYSINVLDGSISEIAVSPFAAGGHPN